ncbi:MAG: DUF427 domain-containing protein [Rhizobiaceae bacterium]|nr:DUF427 domain-containing protein [Rhizobiaceae bacterium]
MSNNAPGFAKHPNHTVEISKALGPVAVTINGQEIARTGEALTLAEANYPIAYYLPKDTFPDDMLQPSDYTTYCPFKGTASYLHLVHEGKVCENAVWCYREPYEEALEIKDRLAIYPNVATVSPV